MPYRAFIVLIPKGVAPPSPDAFRPISLQNCPPKALAKLLVNRLKPVIPALVHPDQTGFLSGRTISENFLYAADVLHVCARTKAPMLVFKLDFSKAFDSVSGPTLLSILRVRGFSEKWLGWISSLLTSSKSAVLLNGSHGPWIQCKNGLRQGDPLSPFLFIIIADVLQRMIINACAQNLLAHPVSTTLPCLVLQYADDTLIIIKADPLAATNLKKNP